MFANLAQLAGQPSTVQFRPPYLNHPQVERRCRGGRMTARVDPKLAREARRHRRSAIVVPLSADRIAARVDGRELVTPRSTIAADQPANLPLAPAAADHADAALTGSAS